MAPQLQVPDSPFDCILIDLDDTMYPAETGISQATKKNIDEFLANKYSISAESATSLRVELFQKYGSSLAGLIAQGKDLHPDEYHSYVHGRLPYDRIMSDPHLAELLNSIRQPKILFTNSDRRHVTRALARLGIEEECFNQIICFETMNPHLFGKTKDTNIPTEVILKPSMKAVKIAVQLAGFNPYKMLFLDDSVRNITMGKAEGLHTVLVGKGTKTKDADYAIDNIHDLSLHIPEIWSKSKDHKEISIEKESIMKSDLDAMIRPPTPIEA